MSRLDDGRDDVGPTRLRRLSASGLEGDLGFYGKRQKSCYERRLRRMRIYEEGASPGSLLRSSDELPVPDRDRHRLSMPAGTLRRILKRADRGRAAERVGRTTVRPSTMGRPSERIDPGSTPIDRPEDDRWDRLPTWAVLTRTHRRSRRVPTRGTPHRRSNDRRPRRSDGCDRRTRREPG